MYFRLFKFIITHSYLNSSWLFETDREKGEISKENSNCHRRDHNFIDPLLMTLLLRKG